MAIVTMDGLIAGMTTGGQKKDFFKASQTSNAAGKYHSLWKAAGQPAAGANPGALAGVVPTAATLGAFSFTNPAGGLLSNLAKFLASTTIAGKLILYDRLWANSTMSGTQTTVDTTLGAVPALTRPDSLGAAVEMWLEFYTAIGATGATLTIRYTAQDGTTLRSATYVHPAAAETVGQMIPVTLISPDTGIRVPTAYSWSISTGTAGDFGITLLRRIAEISLPVINTGALLDAIALGLPQIYDNACLAFMVLCSTTTTGDMQGGALIAQG